MSRLFPLILLFVSNSIFAQQIIPRDIIRRPNPMRNQPIATKSLKITGTLGFQVAQITYDQVFKNTTNRRIEGAYLFPIPKGMTISKFSMEIDGKPTNGELLDANKARDIYEGIVRRQVDPALLEYQDDGLLRLRIFPIEANATRKITLKFETALAKEGNLSVLDLPLPKSNIGSFVVDLTAKSDVAIGNATSPTHPIDVAYLSEKQIRASLEAKNLTGSSAFKFLIGKKESQIEANILVYEDNQNERYFQLMLSPGFAEAEEIVGKDISFALDVSGSMRGQKLEQAKEALKHCISQLNEQDKFNIIRFSTEASNLYQERMDASQKNIKYAVKWIDELVAAGGTNIYDALNLALKNPPNINRPEMVVFITDGRPTIGQTNQKKIIDMVDNHLKENRRIFTFGVGNDLNIKLLDLLTDHSHGFRTYVSEQEDIAQKVSSFYRKVASPVLTNLKLIPSNGLIFSDLQPKKIPDLFRGSTLTLFGKYKNTGKMNITLLGKVNGKDKIFKYHFNPKNNVHHDFIPRLWATRKVAYLYDQIRLNGVSKEVKDELVATAKKYGIITPFTSYLIIEDEAISLRRGALGQENVIWNRNGRQLPDMAPAQESQKQSAAVQQKRLSSNTANYAADNAALSYKDKTGQTQNLANEIQYVNGRAFYYQETKWLDALLLDKNNQRQKTIEITYGSEPYLRLWKQPIFRRYLNLGRQVSFLHNQVNYIIL